MAPTFVPGHCCNIIRCGCEIPSLVALRSSHSTVSSLVRSRFSVPNGYYVIGWLSAIPNYTDLKGVSAASSAIGATFFLQPFWGNFAFMTASKALQVHDLVSN